MTSFIGLRYTSFTQFLTNSILPINAIIPIIGPNFFTSYVLFDNTDHNQKTWDDNRAFHCLGTVLRTRSGVQFKRIIIFFKEMPPRSCKVKRVLSVPEYQDDALNSITFDYVSTLL